MALSQTQSDRAACGRDINGVPFLRGDQRQRFCNFADPWHESAPIVTKKARHL